MARYLGIEVTEGHVKALVLKTAYRKLQIEAIYRLARPAGLEGLSQATGEIVADVGSVDAVYAAVPGTDASLRIVELPKAVAKRGNRVLATELDGSLPFEVEAAIIDAQPIRH